MTESLSAFIRLRDELVLSAVVRLRDNRAVTRLLLHDCKPLSAGAMTVVIVRLRDNRAVARFYPSARYPISGPPFFDTRSAVRLSSRHVTIHPGPPSPQPGPSPVGAGGSASSRCRVGREELREAGQGAGRAIFPPRAFSCVASALGAAPGALYFTGAALRAVQAGPCSSPWPVVAGP